MSATTRTTANSLDTSAYRRKIVDLPRLCQIVAELHAARRSVVQCHGCFDIVHPGHLRYLAFARSQGDALIVSLTGDAAIDKGDMRPYIPQELRAENLAALEFVDYVIIDTHETARELLEALRPDIYVKGHEYAASADPRFIAERELVESYGGRVIFSSGQVVFSSSRLLETMQRDPELEPQRLRAVCRRHDINRRSLTRLIRSMRGKRILVLGDSVIERYILCDANQTTTESPMISLRQLDQRDYLGGAALLAIQAAALGAEVSLVSQLGKGPESEWAARQLNHAGVALHMVPSRAEPPVRARFLVDEHKLLRVERGAMRPLDSQGERHAAQTLSRLSENADAAIIHDTGHGLMSPGLLKRLDAGLLDHVSILTGGAGEPQGDLRAIKNLDLICSSERRLRAALSSADAGLSTLAYEMAGITQARQLIVTMGKRGLVAFDRCTHDRQSAAWGGRLRSGYLPSLAERVCDSFGAGQNLLAAMTLAMACGADLMQAAFLGSAVAALRIERLGMSVVSQDTLLAWTANRAEPADEIPVTTNIRLEAARRSEYVHEPVAL